MDPLTEQDLATLLRMKRHEQPPPGYFDNFIHEFHRRQRAELLQQPLWRIAFQRAHDFMFQINVPSLSSYPVALAAVLVCAAVLSLKISQTPPAGMNVATALVPESAVAPRVTGDSAWSLSTPVAARSLDLTPFHTVSDSASTRRSAAPPRYVLDSTPVSYEASLKF